MKRSLPYLFLALVTAALMVTDASAGGWFYKEYDIPTGKPVPRLSMPYNDHEKMTICTNRSVPPNWIVVGTNYNVKCNGLGNNAWVIQKLPLSPGAEIIICANQPVPPGWAMIEGVKNGYCGHKIGGIRIRKM